MPKTHEAAEFVSLLQREYPDQWPQLAAVATHLMKLARRHHRLQERACNESMPEGYDSRCEADIREACALLPGCEPIFSGDPRGATVKLKVPSGATTDWGGVGICVPV